VLAAGRVLRNVFVGEQPVQIARAMPVKPELYAGVGKRRHDPGLEVDL
jgi:hypothetical protein